MRRLLATVAVLVVGLSVPATALADPTIVSPPPPTPFFTNGAITFTWSDPSIEVVFRLLRGDPTGAACSVTPVNDVSPSGDLGPTTFTTSDTPLEGTYCYYVQAQDALLATSTSAPVRVTYDITAPQVTAVAESGADGCTPGAPFTVTGATANDSSPVSFTANGVAFPPDYVPTGAPYDVASVTVVATDAAGNASLPFLAPPGRINDPTGPGSVSLEVSTDPGAQKATLNWDPVAADGAPITSYTLKTKGPMGPGVNSPVTAPFVVQNLQVDATYEFTLDANDACGRKSSSVRLVRLNDATPPSTPLVGNPGYNASARSVSLSWVPSTDNIQVDHYVILRDGVPLGATDATAYTDLAPPQHTLLTYVVRAVDTNGNSTDAAAVKIMTPDWTPPSAPLPEIKVEGQDVTLRWPVAADNVGVVGYDVLRDDKQVASMTSAVRFFTDFHVPAGVHTWKVLARDDARLSTASQPLTRKISKATAKASVLSMRLAGGGSGAARYSLKPLQRLLVDVRVVGTLAKPRLRLYINGGRGRITVWRGTPGSSSPRLRLGSAVVRHGYVTIRLSRALHAGRIRLVLIAGARVVVAAKGAHKPAMKLG